VEQKEHLLETRIDGHTQIGPLLACKSGLIQHDQVSGYIQCNGDNFLEGESLRRPALAAGWPAGRPASGARITRTAGPCSSPAACWQRDLNADLGQIEPAHTH